MVVRSGFRGEVRMKKKAPPKKAKLTLADLQERIEYLELRLANAERSLRHDAHDIHEVCQRVELGPSYRMKEYEGL